MVRRSMSGNAPRTSRIKCTGRDAQIGGYPQLPSKNNSRGYLQLDPRLSSVWPRCCLEAGDTAARISLLRKNWPCLVRGLLFVIDIHIVRARRAVNLGFAEPSGAGDKVVSERRRPASNNRGYAMHGQWLPSARAGERHSVSGTVS